MTSISNFLVVKELHNLQKINNVPYTAGLSTFDNPIKIGTGAGITTQSTGCIAIGVDAGLVQDTESIAIGKEAGSDQATYSVAVGGQSGRSSGDYCTSMGFAAQATNAGNNVCSFGNQAGALNAAVNSCQFGNESGTEDAGEGSCAFGANALNDNAGLGAIGIGENAAPLNAGNQTITINSSGQVQENTGANSIVINATDYAITTSGTDACYIAPFFEATAVAGSMKIPNTSGFNHYLVYNDTTKEVRICPFV